jgi:hypothetical protein
MQQADTLFIKRKDCANVEWEFHSLGFSSIFGKNSLKKCYISPFNLGCKMSKLQLEIDILAFAKNSEKC